MKNILSSAFDVYLWVILGLLAIGTSEALWEGSAGPLLAIMSVAVVIWGLDSMSRR